MTIKIITPYVYDKEIEALKEYAFDVPRDWLFEKDSVGIGSDLMYQKLWKQANSDVFIFHADMHVHPANSFWWEDIEKYAYEYPKAGMIGCKLLYPAAGQSGKNYIQSAGGYFSDRTPTHYGGGLDMLNQRQYKSTLEEDIGQYDKVRKVCWSTFGGIYLRKEMLDQVGNFDMSYEWSYNRDVDYCMMARDKGWDILQVPISLYHFESKDNARVKPDRFIIEHRNLQRLREKWGEKLDHEISN